MGLGHKALALAPPWHSTCKAHTSILLLVCTYGMTLANSKYHTSENDSKLRCPRGGAVRLVVSVVAMRNGRQGVTACIACHTKYGLLA